MSKATNATSMGETVKHELEELFREHRQLMHRAAYRVTGNPEDADDVVQIIFLRLLRRDSPKDPVRYLSRAAVNMSLNILKSRGIDKVDSGVEVLEIVAPTVSSSEDDDRYRRLAEALDDLKPQAARMLALRYNEGRRDSEIAGMMGQSRANVAKTLSRALAELKKKLTAVPGEKQ